MEVAPYPVKALRFPVSLASTIAWGASASRIEEIRGARSFVLILDDGNPPSNIEWSFNLSGAEAHDATVFRGYKSQFPISDIFIRNKLARSGRTLYIYYSQNEHAFDFFIPHKLELGGQLNVFVKENIESRPNTSISRTGTVVLTDDFEHGLATERWKQAAGTVANAADYPFNGGKCLKITTGTGAADTGQADHWMGFPADKRMGLELWFMSNSLKANITSIAFLMRYYDGVNALTGVLKWLGTTEEKWQYYNASGTWSDVTGGAQPLYVEATLQPQYHHVKFVIDFENETYVSMESDGLGKKDLSAIDIHSGADTTTTYTLYTSIYITNQTATAARDLWLDDVVWTMNEP